jgi:hypothetical protein
MMDMDFEGLTGPSSVLLELAPVLRGMELEVELPVAEPTSVLLLSGALGVQGW